MGSSSPGFGLRSRNMESTMDEPKRCALRMWRQNVGSFVGIVGIVSYAPLLVCRQYTSEQFILVTHELNQLEFAYGNPGYAA